MYAVVRTGGKQYRVGTGDIIEVEKLDGDVGQEITLDDILLVSNGEQVEIGQPTVANASIQAVITGQYRGPKILSFRYRPKKRIRVRRGHRQYLTRLEIKSVSLNGESFTDVMELGPTAKIQPKKEKKTYVPVATPAPEGSHDEGVTAGVESPSETIQEAIDTAVENEGNVGAGVIEADASADTAAVVDDASETVEAATEASEEISAGVESPSETIQEAIDTVVDEADSDDAGDKKADA